MAFLIKCIFILITGCLADTLDSHNNSQNTYFEKISLNHVTRAMKISNTKGEDIINAKLGITLNQTDWHSCANESQLEGYICLEWEHRARLFLSAYELGPAVKCYNIRWIALSGTDQLTDCIELSDKEHWYGGGQNAQSIWQLNTGTHAMSPFITGRLKEHQWGNVLKRYFISSNGAAILIDNLSPLFTSLSGNSSKKFCLKAQYDDFAFAKHITDRVHLNYSICTSSDSAILHSKLIQNTLWDGLKKRDFETIDSLIAEPIWEITAASSGELTEEKIANFTTDIITSGFFKQGHILLNEFWQKQIGDFTVDHERFPDFANRIHIFHRRGFRIVLSIQPFISTESSSFAEAKKEGLFVTDRTSDPKIPALTRYKSLETAGVLDPSRNATITWLLNKLKKLSENYNIDAFFLDTGVAHDIPHHFQFNRELVNLDHYNLLLTKSLSSVNLFGVSSAVEHSKASTFVALPKLESSWSGLRKVIPSILSYGLLGYPFLLPGAIGGDFMVNNYTTKTEPTESLPDKELYVRWFQIASFLPVMKFTFLPSSYRDTYVLDIARNFTNLREKKISPILKKYAKVALDTSLPIIRPLWMMDATDSSCYTVEDEYSIGDELIVAPILHSRTILRDIYLPTGVWRDGIDGSLRKGGQWIKNYKIEQNEIAFFEKISAKFDSIEI